MLVHDLRDVMVTDGKHLVVTGGLASRAADLGVTQWHFSSASAGDVAIAFVIGETMRAESRDNTDDERKEQ